MPFWGVMEVCKDHSKLGRCKNGPGWWGSLSHSAQTRMVRVIISFWSGLEGEDHYFILVRPGGLDHLILVGPGGWGSLSHSGWTRRVKSSHSGQTSMIGGTCHKYHSPPNSDMDYRIFNVCMWPRFIVSSEGVLWSLHRIWLQRNLRMGAKPST